jgi:hypothetical protein
MLFCFSSFRVECGVWMQRCYFGFLLGLSCLMLECNTATSSLLPKRSDNIQIVSVVPDSLLVADSITMFYVRVNYDLMSSDSAVLKLGFNDYDSVGYTVEPAFDTTIMRGSGAHLFVRWVTPTKWASGTPFKVIVNMVRAPILTNIEQLLAEDIWQISSFR